MPEMMSMLGNMLAPAPSAEIYQVYRIITLVLLLVMMVAAIVAILIVLFQPGNSTGIDALGGSSETFFGKNKGRSMESKMKKWTIIVLVILAVLALVFFILQFDTIWWIGYERP